MYPPAQQVYPIFTTPYCIEKDVTIHGGYYVESEIIVKRSSCPQRMSISRGVDFEAGTLAMDQECNVVQWRVATHIPPPHSNVGPMAWTTDISELDFLAL